MSTQMQNAHLLFQPQPPIKATLLAHCGSQKLARRELANLPVPEATDTFQPIGHARMIDSLQEALDFRHIKVVREEYAASPDGMKLFGLMEVNAIYEGVRFAIGLRNSNDKSMRLGMVAGYRVFCCDNLSLAGDFKPLHAKHTKNFDLIEALALGVDRIQRSWQPLRDALDFKRDAVLDDDFAKLLIYRAYLQEGLPVSLMKRTHDEYFKPSYDEFKSRSVWSLENAFTSAFKTLKPVSQYEATTKLARFLAPHTSAF